MSWLAVPGVPDEDDVFKKPREVVHRNTRFLRDPFSQAVSKSQLQQAAALNAQVGLQTGHACDRNTPHWERCMSYEN